MEIDAVLDKNKKRNYFYAAFTIRKAREEAVGDRLIALVLLVICAILHLICAILQEEDADDDEGDSESEM